MAKGAMGKILIIANARRRGGLSGGDNIYLNFQRFWGSCTVWEMLHIGFSPFWLCYIFRILAGCWRAIWQNERYEFVYSASDFLMDSLPAFILKLKGNKWVAGFYMFAPKKNWKYYYSQKIAYWLIQRYADVVCVTNESMGWSFPLPSIAVHGGVNLEYAKWPYTGGKLYDAVFVGRFHYTKGIDELIEIWRKVRMERPKARLAIIGGGDDEEDKVKRWAEEGKNGVYLFGYMGEERFRVYKKSRIVLYPTPYKYSHFSMGPVEAMACGCPMIAFNLPIMQMFEAMHSLKGCALCDNIACFVAAVIDYIDGRWKTKSQEAIEFGRTWAWSKRAPKILNDIRQY